MASAVKWVPGSVTGTQIMTDQEPANGAGILSSEIANGTNEDEYLALGINIGLAADAVNQPFYVYLLFQTSNGWEYLGTGSEGALSTQPKKSPVAVLTMTGNEDAAQTRHFVRDIPIPPFDFQVAVWNASGQNVNSNELDVYAWTYNHEGQ